MTEYRAIVPLRGGFGNQLFCWAYGMNLESNGLRVYYDKGRHLGRGFELEGLIDPRQTVALSGKVWRRMESTSRLWKFIPMVERIVEDELRPPEIQHPSKLMSLHWGYWQSHDFFDAVSPAVSDQLTSWLAPDGLAPLPTCGVHVRRGDYVSDAGAAATLGAQPLEYYTRAISRLREQGFERFVVYTDDRKWVSENLVGEGVHLAAEGTSRDDFLGLSRSSAVIMSNSSFSWWAAFLASRRHVPVVGPMNWFSNEAYDSSRLMRADWERM